MRCEILDAQVHNSQNHYDDNFLKPEEWIDKNGNMEIQCTSGLLPIMFF